MEEYAAAAPPRGKSMSFLWTGALCLVAGIGVWAEFTLSERRAGQEAALNILAALAPPSDSGDRRAREKQALDAAQAELLLFQANEYPRSVVLQTAFQDPADSQRLKGREQPLSISLSQVRRSQAHALYQEAILPAIRNSNDPVILKESVGLIDRWSIADTLSSSDTDNLSGQLVAKMLNTEDTEAIDALADGVTLLAANVSPSVGDDLAWRLAVRSTEETESTVSDAKLPALLALERALGTDSAGELAAKLVDRMLTVQDPFVRRTLAIEARDPLGKVNQTVAGSIADKVADRMIAESNPTSMGAWGTVLDSLKDVIDPTKAGELAGRLAPRILLDLGLAGSDDLFSGWRGLAEKATPQQSENLVVSMTGALRIPELDSHAVRRASAAMAALRASPAAFAAVGKVLLDRMRAETHPEKQAEFGSAVAVLRMKLPPDDVDEASGILVRRMVSEHDPSAIGPLAGALDDLDESISKPKIGEFAAALAARMGVERGSMALLDLAVGFIAVAQQLTVEQTAHADTLATPILARMQSEDTAPALRTLAFTLGTIEDGTNPAKIRAAGAKLAAAMAAETDADDLRALTAGLCALKSAAGPENLAKAAAILSARLGIESDPIVLFNLASSLHALADYAGQTNFQSPASILVKRMVDSGNPAQVQALTRSLSKLAPNLTAEDSAKLASDLIAGVRTTQQPELLRSYGEALGLLPEGSLKEAQIAEIQGLFAIPDAPCEVVTRVNAGDPSRFVREILNPLCSEDSWTQVVVAFDGATKESIVQQGNVAPPNSSDADFTQLVVADDDDESSAGSVAVADNRIEIDFNKLSDALDRFRPAEAGSVSGVAAGALSGALLLAGAILLWISARQTRSV